ncbi:MAG TPA: HisA/HisF-related TIM barrel protein [Candidatus Bilamarchaeaceae archaeon]|nr:HisA/HisF-related TIM barrel protein [Candidatus Bilamarchaeaceae archaeon]
MKVIPAIDLLDGKCVRLKQGKRDQCTIYSDNPINLIDKFKEDGVSLVHVVDLNGAFDGVMKNMGIISELAKRVEIQVGGGIRSKEQIDLLRENGIKRIIVGTKIMELKKYEIIGALDFKDGKIATRGWVELQDFSLDDVLEGLKEVIVTDISKDGMLNGPNIQLIKKIQKRGPKVIASGGIRNIEDLKRLKEIGASGAIIGKAFYEGKISLKEAIERTSSLLAFKEGDSEC